ncbi:MAG: oxidoreductase [Polyangiaceae bacterium]|jgi:NAD(P)-dependent dehydrogenase (short-subunit alcohol dehydrogenase family)
MRAVPKDWNAKRIGDLRGKTAIVTGANSGIGFHTGLELGRAGALVVVACRDPKRGEDAINRLRSAAPGASFRLEALDLADLASVRSFATRFLAAGEPLDILVNNAGVMAIPERQLTAEGFERQFGTNHLGHFALTGLLLPALRRSRAPRAVTVSSAVAYWGRIEFGNLQSERSYSPARAYASSKLANLLFMLELGRRASWLTSVAAHPGATHSNLQQHTGLGVKLVMAVIAQQADRGALPSLYAAVGDVATGEFYGPALIFHMQGSPVEVRLPKRALNLESARNLWDASERLTGVRYELDSTVSQSASA